MTLSNLKPRSSAALVRNLLPEIEAALARGASREAVWESLQTDHGLSATYNGFLRALARARAEKPASPSPDASQPSPVRETASVAAAPASSAVDCAIQKSREETLSSQTTKDRIITPDTFKAVHDMNFDDLDKRY
ncbi:TPA: hypothetical protein ACIRVE_005383 [Pseudomonas putida]